MSCESCNGVPCERGCSFGETAREEELCLRIVKVLRTLSQGAECYAPDERAWRRRLILELMGDDALADWNVDVSWLERYDEEGYTKETES